MQNNIINYNKSQGFWLIFDVSGDGSELLDSCLPLPNYFYRYTSGAYSVGWLIDGYFSTPRGKTYLNDIVARFCVLFPSAMRLYQYNLDRDEASISTEYAVTLADLEQHLPSLPAEHRRCRKRSWKKKDDKQRVETRIASLMADVADEINKDRVDGEKVEKEDRLFEATRWHLYRKAYQDGTESVTVEYCLALLEMENSMLAKPRVPSAVKQKSKRMAKYIQNEFVLKGYNNWSKDRKADYMRNYRKEKGLTMATRHEHIEKVNENKKRRTRAKIKALLGDMFKREEIRFKNGKLKIGVIAKELEMSRNTIAEHLKEMGLI